MRWWRSCAAGAAGMSVLGLLGSAGLLSTQSVLGPGSVNEVAAQQTEAPYVTNSNDAATSYSTNHDVRVTMSDGVQLDTDEYIPTGCDTAHPCPVVLIQTPYRKSGSESPEVIPYLYEHGYAEVVADVRGTGSSEGYWDSFGTREQQDGAQLAQWVAHLPFSNGKVGLAGVSYSGINQLLTVEQLAADGYSGAKDPVKAIFPVVPMSDAYRDVTFAGGNVDTGFIPLWLGLVDALGVQPTDDASSQPAIALNTESQHLYDLAGFSAPAIGDAALGSDESDLPPDLQTFPDQAYDGSFFQERSPIRRIGSVTVPTFIVGGTWDLFQRGEPLLYNGIPLAPSQKKLLIGPWYHVTEGTGLTVGRRLRRGEGYAGQRDPERGQPRARMVRPLVERDLQRGRQLPDRGDLPLGRRPMGPEYALPRDGNDRTALVSDERRRPRRCTRRRRGGSPRRHGRQRGLLALDLAMDRGNPDRGPASLSGDDLRERQPAHGGSRSHLHEHPVQEPVHPEWPARGRRVHELDGLGLDAGGDDRRRGARRHPERCHGGHPRGLAALGRLDALFDFGRRQLLCVPRWAVDPAVASLHEGIPATAHTREDLRAADRDLPHERDIRARPCVAGDAHDERRAARGHDRLDRRRLARAGHLLCGVPGTLQHLLGGRRALMLTPAVFAPDDLQPRPVLRERGDLDVDEAHRQAPGADAVLVEITRMSCCLSRPRDP